MPRRFARLAAVVVAVPLLAAIAGVLAWPWLRPAVVERIVARIEQVADADIRTFGLRMSLRPSRIGVVADRVEIERGGIRVTCHALAAASAPVHAFRGRIETARFDRCSVARSTFAEAAGGDGSGSEAPLFPDPAPWLAAAQAIGERVGTVVVDTVEFDSMRSVQVANVRADFSRSPSTLDIEVTRNQQSGTLRVEFWPNRVAFHTAAPLPAAGLVLGIERAELDRNGVLTLEAPVAEGPLRGSTIEARARRVVVDGPRARPRVVIDDPVVSIDLGWAQPEDGSPAEVEGSAGDGAPGSDDATAEAADVDAVAEAEPDAVAGSGRPQAGVPVAAALDALVARVSMLIDSAERAATAEVPDIDLTVNNAQIELIDGWLIHLPLFRWDGEGRVVGELAAGEVRGAFDLELRRARLAHLSIEGVELADLLPAGSPFSGTTGITAEVKLERGGAVAAIDLTLVDVAIDLPAVAPTPMVGIDAQLRLGARVTIGSVPSIVFESSGLLNGLPVDFSVSGAQRDGAWAIDASGGFREQVACNTIWQALPEALIPNLGRQGVNFDGASQLRLAVRWALDDPQSFELSASGFPGTCTIDRIRRDLDPRILNDDSYVHHVVEGVTRDDIFVGPGTDSYVRLGDLPSYVPAVMYLSEEIGFFTNPGISIGLMNRGMRLNIERSRYAYGGSTVSQQLVKNLFLTRSKTLSRKLEEAVIVWAMESWVAKERILELYLNCIEFGPDIYGIRNAAFHYFGRGPETLTPLEAAWLANLKPSPVSGGRYLQRGHSAETGWWPERLAELLRRLHVYGAHITPEEAAWYAPYIVALPMSPNAAASPYRPIPRPEWAASDSLRVFTRSQPTSVDESAPTAP